MHDRSGRGDLRLLVIAGLRLRIALLARSLLRIGLLLRIALLRWAGLNRGWNRSYAGLRNAGLAAGCLRRGAELAQPLFELTVAVLQFLVLAGELPQLVLKLLNSHFRVDIVGLREGLR